MGLIRWQKTGQRMSRQKTKYAGVNMPAEHYEALAKLADEQDRSLAAEIRLAIARHIEQEAGK